MLLGQQAAMDSAACGQRVNCLCCLSVQVRLRDRAGAAVLNSKGTVVYSNVQSEVPAQLCAHLEQAEKAVAVGQPLGQALLRKLVSRHQRLRIHHLVQ